MLLHPVYFCLFYPSKLSSASLHIKEIQSVPYFKKTYMKIQSLY